MNRQGSVLLIFSSILLILAGGIISILFLSRSSSRLYPPVIIISYDAARLDAFPRSCGGHQRDALLPNLASFCKTATVFHNAYAPGSATWHSIPSIYTGYEPTHHRVHVQSLYLSPAFFTLAEFFKSKGYATMVTTGNRGMFDYVTRFAQGFDLTAIDWPLPGNYRTFYAGSVSQNELEHTAYWHPGTLVSQAMPFIRQHCPRCFVHIHFAEPHQPYGAPLHILLKVRPQILKNRLFTERYKPGPYGILYLPLQRIRPMTRYRDLREVLKQPKYHFIYDIYLSGLVWADEYTGILIQKLKGQKWWQHSVIIITADHGESFGEHGFWEHGDSLFEPVSHIPLIIHFPDQPPGHRQDPVSLVDLYATLLSYFGPSARKIIPVSSHNIRRSRSEWAAAYAYSTSIIRFRQYKLVHFTDRNRALMYDLSRDPDEKNNILPYQFELGRKLFQFMMAHAIEPQEFNLLPWEVKTSHAGEELQALGYIGIRIPQLQKKFNLYPTPLAPETVRYRINSWQRNDHHRVIEIVNTGRSAWPHQKDDDSRGQMVVTCDFPDGDRWTGLFTRDIYPGEAYQWVLKSETPSPQQCQLHQLGYHTWL